MDFEGKRHHNMSLFLVLMLAAVLLMSLANAEASTSDSGRRPIAKPPPAVPGELIVKFKDNVGRGDERGLLRAHGLSVKDEIPQIRVKLLRVPSGAEERLLKALSHNPNIEYIEKNYILELAQVPNDPYYGNQWHLNNPNDADIDAPEAWDTTTGDPNLIIAILDTGVDGSHPELAAKMVPGWNVFNNNSNTSDILGHGTKVAATAAAVTNNAAGVASVCWGCKIMPVRISVPNGTTNSYYLTEGIIWAADHGARIVNAGYGHWDIKYLWDAVDYLKDTTDGLFFMPAGNNACFMTGPDSPYIVGVSSTNSNDQISSWSDRGHTIDLSAPGENIVTISLSDPSSYDVYSGTSYSSPIAAAVAALVISANPSLNENEVEDVLKRSADDLGAPGWDTEYGWGRVNARSAVQMALTYDHTDTTTPLAYFIWPADNDVVDGSITIRPNVVENLEIDSVTISIDGTPVYSTTSYTGPYLRYSFPWYTYAYDNGPHTLTISARDMAGNTDTEEILVTVNNRWSFLQRLIASDGDYGDDFGQKLAAENDLIAVAAPNEGYVEYTPGAAWPGPGAVYPFRRVGPTWVEEDKLTASDGDMGDRLGSAMALSGDLLLVGNMWDNESGVMYSGSAYVFRKVGSEWVEEQKLAPDEPSMNKFFGQSVAIAGDVLAVGAPGDSALVGSVYLFRRDGSAWVQYDKLTASDGTQYSYFGNAMAATGDLIAVAAAHGMRAVYLFRRVGSTWVQEDKLTASGASSWDLFGHSIAINPSGDMVVVGASQANGEVFHYFGKTYVFRKVGSEWVEEQKITPSDSELDDRFGTSVAALDDLIIVGASTKDLAITIGDIPLTYYEDVGAAYVFRKVGSEWVEEQILVPQDANFSDYFGSSVAVLDNLVVVGAHQSNGNTYNSGSAYIFTSIPSTGCTNDIECNDGSSCTVNKCIGSNCEFWNCDLDGNHNVGLSDVMRVISAWATNVGDPGYVPQYDIDTNGNIGLSDIMLIITLWANNC